jgi:hypothetical protein
MGHDSQIQNVKWLANTRKKRGRRKQKPLEDEKPTDSQDWNHSMNPSRNTQKYSVGFPKFRRQSLTSDRDQETIL